MFGSLPCFCITSSVIQFPNCIGNDKNWDRSHTQRRLKKIAMTFKVLNSAIFASETCHLNCTAKIIIIKLKATKNHYFSHTQTQRLAIADEIMIRCACEFLIKILAFVLVLGF